MTAILRSIATPTLPTFPKPIRHPARYSADDVLLYHGDCLEVMREMQSESVDLVVTSPPYPGVEKMWGEMFAPDNFENAHAWLDQVWNACARVLRPGCVLAVNVANTGRRPYLRNNARIANHLGKTLFDEGEIIWNKRVGLTDTAWGSWLNPSSISLTDNHEYILIFRKRGQRNVPARGPVISKSEFLEYRKSTWEIQSASATRVGHCAPFPPELPMRLITLYSFVGETVLDPFLGSGTTLMEAKKLGRKGIGIEKDDKYFDLAERNLSQGVLMTV